MDLEKIEKIIFKILGLKSVFVLCFVTGIVISVLSLNGILVYPEGMYFGAGVVLLSPVFLILEIWKNKIEKTDKIESFKAGIK